MTPQEYSERLTKLYGLVSGDLADVTVAISGAELLKQIKDRVVKQGKGTNENRIGDYSTKPIYVERSQFVKGGAFNPQGKRNFQGNTIGDVLIPTARLKTNSLKRNPARYKSYTLVKPDYTQRKTMYLSEGYKELRNIQGLPTQFIDLKYSGKMVNDYVMVKSGQKMLLGISTDRSAKIYDGLTERFGGFYIASEKEKQDYIDRTNALLQRLTRNTIEGYDITATIS